MPCIRAWLQPCRWRQSIQGFSPRCLPPCHVRETIGELLGIACRSCHHQGLKPHSFHGSARLKPCPETNQIITSCSRKCRNSSRRLSAGVSRCEEFAPGPKAPSTLENKGQSSAQAARSFYISDC